VSRLTKQVKPKHKASSASREQSAVPLTMRPSSVAGVVIDGAVYPLAGEPPVAVTHGWGDLRWLYWPRR
jgi:hypothetical protein